MFDTECETSNPQLRASAPDLPTMNLPVPCPSAAGESDAIGQANFGESLVQGLLDSGNLVVVALVQGRIAYAAPGLWKLVYRSCPTLQGSAEFIELLHEADRPRIGQLLHAFEESGTEFVASCLLADQGRELVAIRIAARRIDCAGVPTPCLIITDVTVQDQQRSHLEFLDTHDRLTGLQNRVALLEATKEAINHAQVREESLAFLLVNLDGFGKLNEAIGPSAGDSVLKIVADRLERSVRGKGDLLGRYGGDEFLLVFRHVDDRDNAAFIAGRIIESLGLPMIAGGQQCQTSASIGIALFPQDGADLPTMLAHANAALLCAKGIGRGRFAFARACDDIVRTVGPVKSRLPLQPDLALLDAQQQRINEAINELGRKLRDRDEMVVLHLQPEERFNA